MKNITKIKNNDAWIYSFMFWFLVLALGGHVLFRVAEEGFGYFLIGSISLIPYVIFVATAMLGAYLFIKLNFFRKRYFPNFLLGIFSALCFYLVLIVAMVGVGEILMQLKDADVLLHLIFLPWVFLPGFLLFLSFSTNYLLNIKSPFFWRRYLTPVAALSSLILAVIIFGIHIVVF